MLERQTSLALAGLMQLLQTACTRALAVERRKSLGRHWSSVYAGTWSLAAERHMLQERRMSPTLLDVCNCCRLDALGHWLWSGVSHWGSMVHRRLLEVLSRWLRSGVCRWSDGCHRRLQDISNCCKLTALGHWLWSSESHCGGIGHRCLLDSFNSLPQ